MHDGERRQVRDAMALSDHVREGRDVFITTDAKAFINHGRREKLEALCSTRIMTPEEFIEWCQVRAAISQLQTRPPSRQCKSGGFPTEPLIGDRP